MNSALFHLRILAAPQLRHTANNQTPIAETTGECSISNGAEITKFPLRLIVWGKTAEAFAADVSEGDRLIVQGALNVRSVDRAEGFKEKRAELNVRSFSPCETDTVLNLVAVVGRAGRLPDCKYFESGSVVVNLTLAVNRRKEDEPDWYDLEIWGRTAEVAANYVQKGSLIGVTGSIYLQTWPDRSTGAERSRPVLKVDRLDLLGSRNDREEVAEEDAPASLPLTANPSPSASPKTVRAKETAPARAPIEVDDEIPF